MSANDYRCAQMDCDARAVAVYIMEGTGAIYGECADHLRPLLERARWIHSPAELDDDALDAVTGVPLEYSGAACHDPWMTSCDICHAWRADGLPA